MLLHYTNGRCYCVFVIIRFYIELKFGWPTLCCVSIFGTPNLSIFSRYEWKMRHYSYALIFIESHRGIIHFTKCAFKSNGKSSTILINQYLLLFPNTEYSYKCGHLMCSVAINHLLCYS